MCPGYTDSAASLLNTQKRSTSVTTHKLLAKVSYHSRYYPAMENIKPQDIYSLSIPITRKSEVNP